MPLQNSPAARKRLNTIALCEALLLPWAMFAGAVVLMSSWVRYYHFSLTVFVVVCFSLLVLLMGGKAVLAMRAAARSGWSSSSGQEPTWYSFLALTTGIALTLAVVVGSWNYMQNVKPYYHLNDLNMARGVDPAGAAGKQYLDASAIVFTEGTHIDMAKSLSYKDGDLYCVAPVTRGDKPLADYDFWVAGVNCCRPFGGDFWCGGKTYDPEALAGLRVTNDADRQRFRLAVQQASAEYGLRAEAPVFLSWTQESSLTDDIAAYMGRSTSILRWSIFLHFILQALCVGLMLSDQLAPKVVQNSKQFAADTKNIATMNWQQ